MFVPRLLLYMLLRRGWSDAYLRQTWVFTSHWADRGVISWNLVLRVRRGESRRLGDLRRRVLDSDWWGLELEWCCLRGGRSWVAGYSELRLLVRWRLGNASLEIVLLGACVRVRVRRGESCAARCRQADEARCVWRGLRAELSKVEIGASFVAHVHTLVETTLGVEAVEHDRIDADCKQFDNNLDNAADQTPVLKTADKSVVHIVGEELSARVVLASPSPQILTVACRFGVVQDTKTYAPHDNAEGEEEYGEDSVVNSGFLSSLMSAAPVAPEYSHGEDE